jgi:hypothetical protein
MSILLALIIVQIGDVITADMNGLPQFLNGQEDINVPNVTNNCIEQK